MLLWSKRIPFLTHYWVQGQVTYNKRQINKSKAYAFTLCKLYITWEPSEMKVQRNWKLDFMLEFDAEVWLDRGVGLTKACVFSFSLVSVFQDENTLFLQV